MNCSICKAEVWRQLGSVKGKLPTCFDCQRERKRRVAKNYKNKK